MIPQGRQCPQAVDNHNNGGEASSKNAAGNSTSQQARKQNGKRKKRNNRQRVPEEKAVRRSTKYDIREDFSAISKGDSGLKSLIKKPLKWLRGLGRK